MKTKGPTLSDTSLHPRIYGQSVKGRHLTLYSRGDLRGATLLIGGIHGDERATVLLLELYLEKLAPTVSASSGIIVIPSANPDSYIRNRRTNANGVDLNRNFPYRWSAESEEPPGAAPLSEPESKALANLILTLQPARIVALHWALAEIDADGPQSTRLAEAMWDALSPEERTPYRLRVWDGSYADYEKPLPPFCPGSLGQWAGFGLEYDNGIRPAMITLELPYDPLLPRPDDPLPDDHLDHLRNDWKEIAPDYLRAVEPGVRRMLDAACGVTR